MIERYILLRLEKEPDDKVVKCWVDTVKEQAPPGVATTLQVYNESGMPYDIRMVKREKEDCFEYLIPLARDLTSKEIAKIVTKFADEEPDLDFDIESNETQLVMNNIVKLDPQGFENLGIELAKQDHNDWLRDRINSGWQYGIRHSQNAKTSPLLLPWEQLPDSMKKPKNDLPQKVIDFLTQQGYAIIPKDELSKIMTMISESEEKEIKTSGNGFKNEFEAIKDAKEHLGKKAKKGLMFDISFDKTNNTYGWEQPKPRKSYVL